MVSGAYEAFFTNNIIIRRKKHKNYGVKREISAIKSPIMTLSERKHKKLYQINPLLK
jgi:hypothetical protein